MANYAIGDIQGCLTELKQLLEKLHFSQNDTVWFCGDLINRGPESLETLRFIKALGDQAVCIQGNHDLHLLAVHFGITKPKRSDTINDILSSPDREELMQWLLNQPLMHFDKNRQLYMVHAGLHPQWSVDKALGLSDEVQQVLTSQHPFEFFKHMYGNEPAQWSDQLTGMDRLRVITNYFTRMRFCTPDGQLEFASKEGLSSQPAGFMPWYQAREQNWPNERCVFGHWAALEGKTGSDHYQALDTGCVWGAKLTAMNIDTLERTSVPSWQD